MLLGQLAHVNLCVSQDIALGSCILAAWPAMLVTPAGTLWMPQSSVWTQTNTQRTEYPKALQKFDDFDHSHQRELQKLEIEKGVRARKIPTLMPQVSKTVSRNWISPIRT